MKICEWLDICCPHCHVDDNLIVGKTYTIEMGVFHSVTCSNCGFQFMIECGD